MQFMYPQYLWALALLALPLLIHLFNFQRPKRVIFSNLRFLRSLQQQSRAARTLKHYVVLSLRMLFLAALVMAFAQPVLLDQSAKLAPVPFTSIYVDNSYSMQGYAGSSQLLDVALTAAEGVVGRATSAERYHLLTNDFLDQGQFFFSKGKTLDHIRSVKYSGTSRDAASILKRQQTAFQTEAQGQRPRLIWVSDFQKSTFPDLDNALADTSQDITLVPISTAGSSNLYIDSAWTDLPFLQPGQKQTLRARVKNAGRQSVDNLVVRLLIDGVQVSTAGVNLPAGGTANAIFDFVPANASVSKAQLELDDSQVSFDNTYYLVFNPAPIVQVVELGQAENPFIKAAYANQQLFSYKYFSPSTVDYQAIGKANLIICNGTKSLGAGLIQALNQAGKRGASILLIPDFPLVNRDAFTALGGFSIEANTSGDSLKANAGNRLAMPSTANPFFLGVFEEQPRNPELPFFGAAARLNGGTTILSLNDGTKLLSQQKLGKGLVYALASSLNERQTDLPRQGLFVPIMLRLAMLSLPKQQRIAYSFQEPFITLQLDAGASEVPFSLKRDQLDVVPGQQLADGKLVLELPRGDFQAGFFDLKRGDSTFATIAINYGKQESELSCYDVKELEALAAANRHVNLTSSLDGLNQNPFDAAQQPGPTLWFWLLVAALGFYLLEILALRFLK